MDGRTKVSKLRTQTLQGPEIPKIDAVLARARVGFQFWQNELIMSVTCDRVPTIGFAP